MSVISVVKDADARTMEITSRFAAPPQRVWKIWSDPRQLERWWGPPTSPATVTQHDLAPGGTVSYFMTAPDGQRYGGWWGVRVVEPPYTLEFDAGFADADGNPMPGPPPGEIRVALRELDAGGTQMSITTAWASVEAMERSLEMGMETGMTAAVGQIDELLNEPEAHEREAIK